jgi:hypothetical protein
MSFTYLDENQKHLQDKMAINGYELQI